MGSQISKILFATDLTKNSGFVFSFADGMARERDARIVMLHVIQPRPVSTAALYEAFGTIYENL